MQRSHIEKAVNPAALRLIDNRTSNWILPRRAKCSISRSINFAFKVRSRNARLKRAEKDKPKDYSLSAKKSQKRVADRTRNPYIGIGVRGELPFRNNERVRLKRSKTRFRLASATNLAVTLSFIYSPSFWSEGFLSAGFGRGTLIGGTILD
jgi:hypothetical protein